MKAETTEEEWPTMAHNGSLIRDDSLTPRQAVALPHIAAESNLARGAEAAQIGRRTLTRWMDDPAFRAELERIRRNISDLAFNVVEGLTLKSVIRLDQLLDDPDPNVRLRALKVALSISLSAKEQKEIRNRIEVVENAQRMMRDQR